MRDKINILIKNKFKMKMKIMIISSIWMKKKKMIKLLCQREKSILKKLEN